MPGLGAHSLPDPRLVDATERGRMHVFPGTYLQAPGGSDFPG